MYLIVRDIGERYCVIAIECVWVDVGHVVTIRWNVDGAGNMCSWARAFHSKSP